MKKSITTNIPKRTKPTTDSPTDRLGQSITKKWLDVLSSVTKKAAKNPTAQIDRVWTKQRLMNLLAKNKNGLKNLWQSYNVDRFEKQKALISWDKVFVYFLGFHLPNSLRSILVLERLEQRFPGFFKSIAKSDQNCVIYDYGSGTGAVSKAIQSFLEVFGYGLFSVKNFDKNSILGKFAQKFFTEKEFQFKRLTTFNDLSFERTTPDGYGQLHILCLGYAINEWQGQSLKSFVAGWKKATTWISQQKNPWLIVLLDSAQQHESRQLMQIRDDAVAAGLEVMLPCTHNLSCPMLNRSRDWCFSELRLPQNFELQAIDRTMGRKRDHFSTSAYVFWNGKSAGEEAAKLFKEFREKNLSAVVGRPLDIFAQNSFVKKNILLCNQDGITKIPSPSADSEKFSRGTIYPANLLK